MSSRFSTISLFGRLWVEGTAKPSTGAPALVPLMIAATVTKKAGVNIFSNPHHAQFLAAAASASSIPKLHGVPEASLG